MSRLKSDIERITQRSGPIKARDGAIIDLMVDEATETLWKFQFRKNAQTPYRWIFIGGPDLYSYDGTNYPAVGTGTTVPGTPAILVPVAGVYIPKIQASIVNASAGGNAVYGISSNGTSINVFNQTINMPLNGITYYFNQEYPIDGQVFAAGTNLQAAYQTSVSAGGTFLSRMLSLRPRRIAI